MQHVSVNTPELSQDSLQPYDNIYPICGMNWYSHKKMDINMTNLNVNIDGICQSNDNNINDANDEIVEHASGQNFNNIEMNMDVDNEQSGENDVDMDNRPGDNDDDDDDDDDEVSENGDDDEKQESDHSEQYSKGNTAPIYQSDAPKPKNIQTAGLFDSVLSPNFNGKHKCLIRKEIRNSKYFFLYQQNCECIMTVRNNDNLNVKCSSFKREGKCCCFVSVG